MQLIKRVNRIVADKEYAKYELVIPPPVVQELGWSAGEPLEYEVRNEALTIRKARPISDEAIRIAARHVRVRRK